MRANRVKKMTNDRFRNISNLLSIGLTRFLRVVQYLLNASLSSPFWWMFPRPEVIILLVPGGGSFMKKACLTQRRGLGSVLKASGLRPGVWPRRPQGCTLPIASGDCYLSIPWFFLNPSLFSTKFFSFESNFFLSYKSDNVLLEQSRNVLLGVL